MADEKLKKLKMYKKQKAPSIDEAFNKNGSPAALWGQLSWYKNKNAVQLSERRYK